MPKSTNNYKTSSEYELLIHSLLHQQLGELSGVDILELNHNVAMKGISGYVHQIDILYRIKIWLSELLVIVECKQYKKSVGVDDLLEFKSRLDDLRAHKGIFVTSSGYQSGAIEFASANRISLLIINATKEMAVAYSLKPVSPKEKAINQVALLKNMYPTIGREVSDRIRVEKNFEHVIVEHKGVSLKLRPRELEQSMLYRLQCDLSDPERNGIYFASGKFTHLPSDKVLKSFIVDTLLSEEE